MSDQTARADAFHALHVKGNPLILFNIWDAGSAKAVAKAGAKAIATGSAPVAMANGYADGEQMPMELALANAKRISEAVSLPVTLDFEGGYAADPETITKNVRAALETGVIGFNFEDQVIGTDGFYAVEAQALRVAAVRSGCEAAGVNGFINARTDLFLKAKPEVHDTTMLDEAITRARAYADAGASGFFAPGLKDERLIGTLCEAVDLPVNMIALPGTPENKRLAELGVARVSYGPVPYRAMTAWLGEQAAEALASV